MTINFDPCANVQKLNFRKTDDLKIILKRDKHTRIEGLCAEHLFLQDVVKNVFPEVSTSWWFCRLDGTYSVFKLQLESLSLSELDGTLLSFFKGKNLPTFVVGFEEESRTFYSTDAELPLTNDFLTNWTTKRKDYPKNPEGRPVPKSDERDQSRLEQAILYLEQCGKLKSAALERLFANCFIRGKQYWDIDVLAINEGKIVAFEVKQKYPTKRKTFGLNVGLAKLFSFLNSLGIMVIHVILTKPIADDSIPAIDFYTKEIYKERCYWIACRFDPSILSTTISEAPHRTSIFTSSALQYYHIDPTKFHVIKTLGSADSGKLNDFLNGRTVPLQSLDELKIENV